MQIPIGINTLWTAITSRSASPSVEDKNLENTEVDNKIEQLIENIDQLDDSDLLDQVTKTFQEESNLNPDELIADPNYQQNVFDANKRSQISLDDLKENTVNVEINEKQEDEKEDLPNIDIDSSSSSNNHYFPKPDVTPQEIKTGFKSIIDNIDNNIIQSPSTNQLGLQPSSSKLSPLLMNKPSISNLLDDTNALFEDDDNEIDITTEIKSPMWNNLNWHKHTAENFIDNEISIQFNELWGRAKTIQIITNDNQKVEFTFDTGIPKDSYQKFNWGNKVIYNNNNGLITKLNEIIIVDLDNKTHSIFKDK